MRNLVLSAFAAATLFAAPAFAGSDHDAAMESLRTAQGGGYSQGADLAIPGANTTRGLTGTYVGNAKSGPWAAKCFDAQSSNNAADIKAFCQTN
jgi:hypothetical protein